MAEIRSFRELDVYRLAREQAKLLFLLTSRFPREEMYSLTDQVRRSSRAVNAMIAEAWARRTYPAEFASKLSEALGEAAETQVWLDHALDCGYVDREKYKKLSADWQSISAMIFRMIEKTQEFCRTAESQRIKQKPASRT